MSLFTCDGCSEAIPAHKARIHCEECHDYDVCANCYVIGKYTNSHTEAHSTILKEKSGNIPKPPPLSGRPAASTVPAVPPNINNHSAAHRAPELQPRPDDLDQVPQLGRSTPGTGGWTPLFNGSQPTPLMVAFFNIIFSCLDTNSTGLLAPEQYSAFCDVQGYQLDEDVWKRNMKPHYGFNPEDIADAELRTAYENFSIDHTLQTRIIAPNTDFQNLTSQMAGIMGTEFSAMLGKSTQPPPISGGKMPMLSRKGFVDITTVEIVSEPSSGWPRLNRMARHYGVWREWGDIPRDMLPNFPPQDLLDRIKRISEFSRRQAAEKLEAKRVELELEAQGQWNAQRLLDPPGTTYVYRHI